MSQWVKCLVLFGLIGFGPAYAVDVIFIEQEHKGQLVQLEPGGRFFHVAIRYQGAWLHAYPPAVAFTSNILQFGQRFVTLRNPYLPEPEYRFVSSWLSKPFDQTYSWNNPLGTYCSRLVAEALGIAPKPMSFATEHWNPIRKGDEGQLGLSPDDLYAALIKMGFRPVSRCELALESR